MEQHKPLSDHRSRAGMDASLTSEEESQSGFSFKVIIVFFSYCGASWCPPAWPGSDSEGYKEYVLHPGLIDEVAAVLPFFFSVLVCSAWSPLPGLLKTPLL